MENKETLSRRRFLKALAATGGAVAASSMLPGEWVKPVVEAGVLPAHAQVTMTMARPIWSNDIPDSRVMPDQFTCFGADISPHVGWQDVTYAPAPGWIPPGTLSFVLVCRDMDAANFIHWLVYDIPPATRSIPQGGPVPGLEGTNDFLAVGYNGPCPPAPDPVHRYEFMLYALDIATLALAPGANWAAVNAAMAGHILLAASFYGTYDW